MKNNKRQFPVFLASLLLTLLTTSCSPIATRQEHAGIIDADHPLIRYTGRVNFTNPKKVCFDWAGTSISARFEGTSCSLRLYDTTDEYAVIIDQNAPRLFIPGAAEVQRIISNLPDSIPHTILIQKRTEPLVGHGIFMGFILDTGASLLPLQNRPLRRIEFIGNSMTSGYGVMGDSAGCHFSPQTENALMSYAGITSRALHAEYHLISFSGRGVVRNYGDSSRTSINPMPSLYRRTCCTDSSLNWNFQSWTPQVTIINLGTNDFSTEPFPDRAVFQAAYHQLIERVRTQYPGVTIFCVSGPMIEEPCTGFVREVVQEQQLKQGRDKDIFFVEVPRALMTGNDWGCDMHPNVYGANKIADLLISMIKLRMNW